MEFLDDAMRMGAEQPYTIAAKGGFNLKVQLPK